MSLKEEKTYRKKSTWYCSCGCVFEMESEYENPYVVSEACEQPKCPKEEWYSLSINHIVTSDSTYHKEPTIKVISQ